MHIFDIQILKDRNSTKKPKHLKEHKGIKAKHACMYNHYLNYF